MISNQKILMSIIVFLTLILSACSEEEGQSAKDIVIEDIYIEMNDGVKLASRVYRPDDNNRYPVLLARTTYYSGAFGSKEEGDYRELGIRMAEKGYVVVIQDVRGLHSSEGEWRLFKDDASDGYQTVIWLNKQTWSNGKVGVFGTSALGMTANLLATTNPPGLKAAFVQMAPSQFYEEVLAEGGIYRHELATRWMYFINSAYSIKMLQQGKIDEETYSKIVDANKEFPDLFLHTPLNSFPYLSDNTSFTSIFEHYIQDEYYDYYDIPSNFSNIKIPIYHLGGWYDTFLEGTMKNYLGLQQFGGKGAKGNQKLLMGPWTHQDFGQNGLDGDSAFFEGDEIYLITEMERWFDYWLKDIDTGVMEEDPIKYYTIGANEWRTTKVWPVADVEKVKWYFNNEKSNSATSINDSLLSNEEPLLEAKNQFRYDPKNPIITIGGRNLFSELGLGPLDQRPAEKHSLTYTSEPLTEPLEIGGTVLATLYVSSDAIDTDFTVKLTDVSPDGTSNLLNEGALRMRFREGLDREVFMEKGKMYEIEINLHVISHVFNEGHRIRVAVASSNFPRFDRNSNTGNPLGVDSEEDFVIAENAVHIGPEHLSHITLPVIKKQ
ncbi:CocE/NonD family hydrolase [Solibacillus sp. MA9]|uniref:CocE/NonD family hydrolase n=1 Tax=Solibacillus palustris TaxID=2908203 RepID=A0ABS9U9L1_9BACL|nr:CocE/NonD family hydrolase [Solibacillus sp. MA9]MCH7321035.1 CocE/NonD family hydrolase [Solibacillus sp. MA9]